MATKTKETFKGAFGEVLITPRGRVSYPHLFQRAPDDEDGNPGKFDASLYIEKKADLKRLKEECLKVMKETWPKLEKLSDLGDRHPFKDGDESDDEAAKGCFIIRARSKNRPGIVGPDRKPIDEESDVYGGCYGRMSVKPFTYNKKGNKGVALMLQNFQKLEDGEPFGARRTKPEDDFAEDGPAPAKAEAEDDDL